MVKEDGIADGIQDVDHYWELEESRIKLCGGCFKCSPRTTKMLQASQPCPAAWQHLVAPLDHRNTSETRICRQVCPQDNH